MSSANAKREAVWPPGGGEMARRIRDHDWAATVLGPIGGWSPRLRLLVEMMLDSPQETGLMCGAEKLFLYNDAASLTYGGRHPAALGRPIWQSFPELRPALGPALERAIAGEAVTIEAQPLDLGGPGTAAAHVYDTHLMPVREEDGRVAYVQALGFDIGPRLRAEAALRESQSRLRESEGRERERALRFRTIFDSAPVGLSVIAADGRFLRVNRELARILGRAEDELLSRNVGDVTHPADATASAQALARTVRSGEPQSLDKRYVRSDGELVPANSTLSLLSFEDGKAAVLAVTTDLTARKRAEQALRESEERFRQFGDASSDILWMRDAQALNWTYLTPAFETIYGLPRAEALSGNTFRNWIDLIEPDDRPTAFEAVRRVRAGESVSFDYRIRRPADGEVRWLRNTDFPLVDAKGEVSSIGGIGRDITEERALSERQLVLVAELQHRTRNLLGVVRSVAERTIAGSTSLEDFLARFRERLGALSRINGLLSKLEQGERVTFDELIRAELEARGFSNGDGGGHVVLEGPEGVRLRSATVQTFALAIHELTTNAVKYGALRDGTGRLAVRWRVTGGPDARGERLHVEWVESGIAGMPEPGSAPRGGGYGRELIERALPYQLQARTSYELCGDGVRCTIDLPLG